MTTVQVNSGNYRGRTSGEFIVKLRDGIPKQDFITQHGIETTHSWTIINGFAGRFDEITLSTLRASPDVEFVENDVIMQAFVPVVQNNAPWGLSRLNQLPPPPAPLDPGFLDFPITYDDSAGAGVNIYIVDTGVRVTHVQFGGRASWGIAVGGHLEVDDNGHGTHCAGIAAGEQFGLAKLANIIAVKVLDQDGEGPVADVIDGLEFVLDNAAIFSVVNMSLGGDPSAALDLAVANLIAAGIHVVVAAGNDNEDAINTSPARAPGANTIGATDIANNRAPLSNFGAVVDLFAPGVDIISAWNTDDAAVNPDSGTSMAAPYVSGLIAYLISLSGNVPPAIMTDTLVGTSVLNALANIPPGTANRLAHYELDD